MTEKQPSATDQYRQLRWQCRRGIKEVEVLLVPFFEARFVTLDADQRQGFERLLAQADVDLFAWFMEHEVAEDEELRAMVEMILQHARQQGA